MGTIVKFKPDIDYYYSRGLSQYESDNFIDALKNYREAYKFAENPAGEEFRSLLEVEMACCYRHLGLIREAQLMYYKALVNSDPDSAFDSIIGLIDIFGTQGNDEALRYYMDMAARKGFSREIDYMEAASQFFNQRDYRIEPTPDKNMYELGRRLLEAGQYDFARQLLEVIPPASSSYGEACNKLVAIYNASEDYEKALEYAEKAAGSASGNEALVNSALAYYKLGRMEEYQAVLDEICAIDSSDISTAAHIVRVMAIIGNGDMVIKFGKKLALKSPQRSPMLCYAIALANSGDLREARRIMVMLQALYPYDAVIGVYSVLISRLTEKSDFPLTCELPADAEAEILGSLNGALSECGSDRAQLRAKLRDPSYRLGILMVFQAGSDNSKRILADIMAEVPFYERYIRDCLMDADFPDSDKRILLPVALKRLKKRPLYLTCRDVCRPLYGRPPAKLGAKWRDAYCLAYGAVAQFGCENFEKDFDAVFAKLQTLLAHENDLDEFALAAVVANKLKAVSALENDECCIELFGADRDKYFKYKNKRKNTAQTEE